MTREEAINILGADTEVDDENRITNTCQYMNYQPRWMNTITLDSAFTLEELRAIVTIMEHAEVQK